jgi:tetratricopeptide (TPR) repeat protein
MNLQSLQTRVFVLALSVLPVSLLAQAAGPPPSTQQPGVTVKQGKPTPEQLAQAKKFADLFNRAMAHQTAGRTDEAITLYKELVAKAPLAYPAWMNMGLLYQSRGQIREAESAYRKAVAAEPKNAVPVAQLGLLFLAERKIDKAIPFAKQAIALDPKAASAHMALGAAYAAQNKLDLAEPELRKAVELAPDNAQCHFHLAVLLNTKKKPDEALSEIGRAVQLDPNMGQAHFLQGTLFHMRKSYRAAIAAYQKAAKLLPKNPMPEYNIGVAYENLAEAEKQFRFRDEAISAYLRALEADPNYNQARVNVARLYRAVNNSVQSMEHFRKALAANPSDARLVADTGLSEALAAGTIADPEKRKALLALAESRLKAASDKLGEPILYVSLARIYENQGKVDLAAGVFERWALKKPNDPEPLLGLARAREAQKRPADAADLYEQVITRKPKDPVAYLALAKMQETATKKDDAEKTYKRLIAVLPKNPDGHRLLGNFYLQQGRYGDAIASFAVLKQLDPKDPVGYLSSANAYERAQRFPEALAEYQALVKMKPEDISMRVQKARLLEAMKRYDDAIAEYRELERIAPKSMYASNVARILESQGKNKEALEEYKRIYLLDPKNPQNRAMWAAALEKAERYGDAIHEYELILESNKNANWAWIRIGGIYRKMKRYADARVAYMNVVESPTDAGEVYGLLEEIYYDEGRVDAWIAFLKAQIDRFPSSTLILSKLEATFVKEKRQDELYTFLDTMATKNELNRGFQLGYAALLQRHGKPDRALAIHQKLAASAPDDFPIRETILAELEKAGKQAEMAKTIEEIVKIKSVPAVTAASYRVRLAAIYEKASRNADAKALYAEAMKLDPKNTIAAEAFKRLGG